MKVEVREVPATKLKKVYIASDGTEFDNKSDCKLYEIELGYKGIKVWETAIHDLYDFDGVNPASLYNIENEEDWNFLVERVWFNTQTPKEYPGPGHYLAIYYDGGDYDGSYFIEDAEQYITGLHHSINSYEEQIYNELVKFNT